MSVVDFPVRVRFEDKEPPRTAYAEGLRTLRVANPTTADEPIPKPKKPVDLLPGDKAKLTLWELAEYGMHKEIAWKVERTLDIDVNQRDKYGRTALMWAAEQGHVAAIETLLDLGSDRTIRDPHTNRSALHLAARSGQADALRALLEDLDAEERTAFLNDADKNGITPVFLAKQKGEDGQEAFEYLLQNGARFTQQAYKEMAAFPGFLPEPKTPQPKYSGLSHVFSNASNLKHDSSLDSES